MISTIKRHFYFPKLKADIAMFIAKYHKYQLVKAEHQHHSSLLQPFPFPEWKWEVITVDFITGLLKRKKKNDSIFVVIDKMSKAAHFIPVKSTYKALNIVNIFLKEIFRLHGIPKAIISDRDVKFIGNFWRSVFSRLEMQLKFSTAYHLQMDGQTERVNQIVEDMLRMYVMNNPTKWEDYLYLANFAYKNGYQDSSKMSHFEVLYGWKCRAPVTWDSPVDRLMLGPDLLFDLEQLVTKVQGNHKEAQVSQKIYVNKKIKYK